MAGLALIGGLAAACFTKAFGIVFLGEPRSAARARTRTRPALAMRLPDGRRWPPACVLIGLLAPLAGAGVAGAGAVAVLPDLPADDRGRARAAGVGSLTMLGRWRAALLG